MFGEWIREIEMRKLTTRFRAMLRRRTLKNRTFTIISNNCWGGVEYSYYGLPYRTPFVGLFLREDDFVKMLGDLQSYMQAPLVFQENGMSKYPDLRDRTYPLAVLQGSKGDVEIHFMHYTSENEAREKWERRKQRMNYDNMIYKLSERTPYCTVAVQKAFLDLNLKRSILFTQHKELCQDDLRCLYIPELENVGNRSENGVVRKHLDTRTLFNHQ